MSNPSQAAMIAEQWKRDRLMQWRDLVWPSRMMVMRSVKQVLSECQIDDLPTARRLIALPPRYPVPALHSHLNYTASELDVAWEDFKAIGWHGLHPFRR